MGGSGGESGRKKFISVRITVTCSVYQGAIWPSGQAQQFSMVLLIVKCLLRTQLLVTLALNSVSYRSHFAYLSQMEWLRENT